MGIGCRSWYQDERTGESSAIWPASAVAYQRRTSGISQKDYVFGGQDPPTASAKYGKNDHTFMVELDV